MLSYWLFSPGEEQLIASSSAGFVKNEHIQLHASEEEEDSTTVIVHNPIAVFDKHNSVENDAEFHAVQSNSVCPVVHDSSVKNSGLNKELVLLCCMAFVAYFVEGSVGDWSAIYLHDNMHSSIFISFLGIVGFQTAVVLGRYFSDHIVLLVGRGPLLRAAGVIGSLGLLCVSLGPSLTANNNSETITKCAVIGGFTLCGVGVSVVAPSVFSMVGQGAVGDMDQNDAVAIATSVGYLGVSMK